MSESNRILEDNRTASGLEPRSDLGVLLRSGMGFLPMSSRPLSYRRPLGRGRDLNPGLILRMDNRTTRPAQVYKGESSVLVDTGWFPF